MDTQETAHEEDAGMEELERSAPSPTPARIPRRFSENFHAQLAQLGQSAGEYGSTQQLVQGDWSCGPHDAQCRDCVAVLRTAVDASRAVYVVRTHGSLRGVRLG